MTTLKRPQHEGLRHLALNVLDMSVMETFYADLLGFEIEWRPDADNLYLTSGADNLALHKVKLNADVRNPSAQALDHLGLIIKTPDGVDEWFAFLEAHQVEMVTQPKTHRDGARSFYCKDPEANVVQIIYHPPIS